MAHQLKMYGAWGKLFLNRTMDHHPTLTELHDMADEDGWDVSRASIQLAEGHGDRLANLAHHPRKRDNLTIAPWDNQKGYVPITYRLTKEGE